MAQQDVKFNIVANTQGMEAIAALINRVGALEAETNKLRTANAGLAASTDAVVRNGVRYNNALDAQAKALRNARQGGQQFGMQINDLATSISTGASPIQAFNQQLGQMGYALSMMGGVLGKVGRFLAGPWGAAITIGTMLLAPFISKLWESSEATDKLSKKAEKYTEVTTAQRLATSSLMEITDELNKLSGRYNETLQEQADAAITVAKAKLQDARATMQQTLAQLSYNRARAADMNISAQAMARTPGEPGAQAAAGAAAALSYSFTSAADESEAAVEKMRAQVKGAEDALQYLQTNGVKETGGRSRERSTAKAVKDLADELGIVKDPVDVVNKKIAALRSAFDAGKVSVSDYTRTMQAFQIELAKAAGQPGIEGVAGGEAIAGAIDITQQLRTIAEEGGKSIRGFTEEMQNAFDAVGMSVNDAFKGMLTAGMSWKDGMKGIIQSVIDELWRVFVVQQIVGMVSKTVGGMFGAPVSGGGSSAFNSAFAEFGTRAIGGSVSSNTPYLVGERGPELFVPGGNGTIIPNKNMGGGSSGNTISVNVDARGSSDPAAVRAQVQKGILEAAPAIIAAAEQRTITSLQRPRLGGAIQ